MTFEKWWKIKNFKGIGNNTPQILIDSYKEIAKEAWNEAKKQIPYLPWMSEKDYYSNEETES
jgi:hypothetical protein